MYSDNIFMGAEFSKKGNDCKLLNLTFSRNRDTHEILY